MSVENANYVHELVATNPVGTTDKVSSLDDHAKLIKRVLLNTLPNILGQIIATHTEINWLVGVTSAVQHAAMKNVANGIAGLDSAAQLLSAQMPNDPLMTTLRLGSVVPVSLSSGGHALTLGAVAGFNVGLSAQAVQARVNGSPGTFYINPYGGSVDIGINLGADANILRGLFTSIAGASGVGLRISNMADGGPTITAVQNNTLAFYTSLGVRTGFFGYPASLNMYMRNEVRGGGLRLEQTLISGAVEGVLVSAPGSNVTQLLVNNLFRFGVTPDGVRVNGSVAGGNGGSHRSQIDLYDSTPLIRANIGYYGAGYLLFHTQNPGAGEMLFQGVDAGNVAHAMLFIDPKGGGTTYYLGAARVTWDASGGQLAGIWNVGSALQVGGVDVSLVGHAQDAATITTGILATARGGTGTGTATGSGNNVLATSPSISDPTISGTAAMAAATVAGSAVKTAAEFAASLTGNGYQKFPGGFTIQWGKGTGINSANSGAITFPTPFTGAVYSIVVTASDGAAAAGGMIVTSSTTSGFIVYNGGPNTQSPSWIAIGSM